MTATAENKIRGLKLFQSLVAKELENRHGMDRAEAERRANDDLVVRGWIEVRDKPARIQAVGAETVALFMKEHVE